MKRSFYKLVIVVCAGIGTFALTIQKDHKTKTFGRFTEQQILRLSAPLGRILVPRVPDQWLVAERTTSFGGNGAGRSFWQIDCLDASGKHLAHIDWDADTGKLTQIAVFTAETNP